MELLINPHTIILHCTHPDVECEHGAVRLVGGANFSIGRLEFCAHGLWGRVCNSPEHWGPDNAKVVCHQLGCFGECEIIQYRQFSYINSCTKEFSCIGSDFLLDNTQEYGTSHRYAVIGEIYCGGSEPELLDCAHATIGEHNCYQINSSTPDLVISCDCGRNCAGCSQCHLINAQYWHKCLKDKTLY